MISGLCLAVFCGDGSHISTSQLHSENIFLLWYFLCRLCFWWTCTFFSCHCLWLNVTYVCLLFYYQIIYSKHMPLLVVWNAHPLHAAGVLMICCSKHLPIHAMHYWLVMIRCCQHLSFALFFFPFLSLWWKLRIHCSNDGNERTEMSARKGGERPAQDSRDKADMTRAKARAHRRKWMKWCKFCLLTSTLSSPQLYCWSSPSIFGTS
jgi:hypothetical protein